VTGDEQLVIADKLIIGVDPGLQTGLAWLMSENGDEQFSSIDLLAMEACDKIAWLLARWRGRRTQWRGRQAVIGAERFVITGRAAKMTRQNDALEVIGTCRWLARAYESSFLLQAAGEAQRIGSRATLLQLGWWMPSGDHLNKAAAQTVLAYQRAYPHEFAHRIYPGTIDA